MMDAPLLDDVMQPDGLVEIGLLSAALRVSRTELAIATGVSRDAMSKTARLRAPATQSRLRDMVVILNRVRPWCGSLPLAFAWYRAAQRDRQRVAKAYIRKLQDLGFNVNLHDPAKATAL
jgi:hypothetical protein